MELPACAQKFSTPSAATTTSPETTPPRTPCTENLFSSPSSPLSPETLLFALEARLLALDLKRQTPPPQPSDRDPPSPASNTDNFTNCDEELARFAALLDQPAPSPAPILRNKLSDSVANQNHHIYPIRKSSAKTAVNNNTPSQQLASTPTATATIYPSAPHSPPTKPPSPPPGYGCRPLPQPAITYEPNSPAPHLDPATSDLFDTNPIQPPSTFPPSTYPSSSDRFSHSSNYTLPPSRNHPQPPPYTSPPTQPPHHHPSHIPPHPTSYTPSYHTHPPPHPTYPPLPPSTAQQPPSYTHAAHYHHYHHHHHHQPTPQQYPPQFPATHPPSHITHLYHQSPDPIHPLHQVLPPVHPPQPLPATHHHTAHTFNIHHPGSARRPPAYSAHPTYSPAALHHAHSVIPVSAVRGAPRFSPDPRIPPLTGVPGMPTASSLVSPLHAQGQQGGRPGPPPANGLYERVNNGYANI